MSAVINVVTTVDGKEALERIGRSLLERKLIACLQVVGPIKSLYWWKGSIEDAEEWIGIMKTRRELYDQVEKEKKKIDALFDRETGVRGCEVKNKIKDIMWEYCAPGLSFREPCRQQVCGGCAVLINKKRVLACDALSEQEMVIEPIPRHRVLKDLIVDFSAEENRG